MIHQYVDTSCLCIMNTVWYIRKRDRKRNLYANYTGMENMILSKIIITITMKCISQQLACVDE